MNISLKSNDDSCTELTVLKDVLKEYLMEKDQVAPVDMILYVIVPEVDAFDLIIDLVNDTNVKREYTTACYVIEKTEKGMFDDHQLKSTKAIGEMVRKNGGYWFETEGAITQYLDSKKQVAHG
ncbi:MAG: hypothetical protein AAGA66_03950 [Bacteroidota bacterium]